MAKKPRVIVITNHKGGVGKTTTATNLVACLTALGHKALLVDADQQANSTDTYRAEIDGTSTLFDVILDRESPVPINEAIQKTEVGDIVAGDPALKKGDEALKGNPSVYFLVREALEGLSGYEYVVFDTNPADSYLLQSCIAAADTVIVPIQPARYSIQGLSALMQVVASIKKYYNPALETNLLLTNFDPREILARDAREGVKSLGIKVYDTAIRKSVDVAKSQAARQSLIAVAPKSNVTADYMSLAKEIIKEGGRK